MVKVGGVCKALIRSIMDEDTLSVSGFIFVGGSCDVMLEYGGVALLVISGGRSSPNSWRRQVISFFWIDSFSFSTLSSVRNSLRISEMTSIGDTSDVLFVSIVDPPGRYYPEWRLRQLGGIVDEI